MLRIIAGTLGTWGDVEPFIAIGEELRRRGHTVTLMTHAPFEDAALKAGLEFQALDTRESYGEFLDHRDHWNWRKNFAMGAQRVILPSIRPVYEFIEQHYQPGKTVVLAYGTVLGARIAQERLGCPLATIHLAPFALRTLFATPQYAPINLMPAWIGKIGKRIAYWLQDLLFIEKYLGPGVNRFRAEVGLSAVSHVYSWANSPQRVIGLWPEWFGPMQPDWPPQAVFPGFIFREPRRETFNDTSMPDLPAPPVVFTAGTGVVHGEPFFRAAAEACRQLSCPGILVTRHKDQIPESLPPNVVHVSYAPFTELFPRAAAIVHHGGIGTAACALRAGIPQVAVPTAVDQFDNAHRLQKLGVGRRVHDSGSLNRGLVRQLECVLSSRNIIQRCREWRARIDPVFAIQRTCEVIEALANNGSAQSSVPSDSELKQTSKHGPQACY